MSASNNMILEIGNIVMNDTLFSKKYTIDKIIKKYKNKISFSAIDNNNNKKVFIKAKYKKYISKDEKDTYNILIKKKHNNIENIIEIVDSDIIFYIISEFIDGYSLDLIKQPIKKDDLQKIIINCCEGLRFIHDNNIIHCDIKLDNIMYSDNKIIIVDFDLAKIIDSEKQVICTNSVCGTEYYIAPESFDLKIYSKKSDIWSLGMCFYKLITGKFPYTNECGYNQTYNFYIRNCFQNLNFDLLNCFQPTYGNIIILIIKNMLNFNDDQRNSCSQILDLIDKNLANNIKN